MGFRYDLSDLTLMRLKFFVPYRNQFSISNQHPINWFLLPKENQKVKQNISEIVGISYIEL